VPAASLDAALRTEPGLQPRLMTWRALFIRPHLPAPRSAKSQKRAQGAGARAAAAGGAVLSNMSGGGGGGGGVLGKEGDGGGAPGKGGLPGAAVAVDVAAGQMRCSRNDGRV